MSSSTHHSPPSLDLTFGLEIQFDLAVLPASFTDPHHGHGRLVYEPIRHPGAVGFQHPETDKWHADEDHELFDDWSSVWAQNARTHIAECLHEYGYNTHVPGYDEEGTKYHEPKLIEKFQHQAWTIADKEFHQSGFRHGYFLLPMEIQSPPMPFNEGSLLNVRRVLQVVSERYMILCNTDAAIHVHIGNSGNPFPLRTLVNFALLAWTFERPLLQIHPPRFQNYQRNGSTFPPMINIASLVSRWAALKGHRTPIYGLETIAACKNIDELVFLVKNGHDDRRLTYNLLGLSDELRPETSEGDDPFKRTVEFRQHKSHFDPLEVTDWISVCAAFMRKAHSLSTESTFKHCRSLLNGPPDFCSLQYTLMFLGCDEEQVSYYITHRYPTDARPMATLYDRPVAYGPIDTAEVYHYPAWSPRALSGGRENRPKLPPRNEDARRRDRPGPTYPEEDYGVRENYGVRDN
ncbi:hypothetical protein CJF31_00003577 [Rutstroemia sp. NJR-2017a BVV2]|nr:hypothetical protein CJF31_00003577 [Rutstroemia sp. NJR-2017a BVV2]